MSIESRIDGIEARIHGDNVALPANNGRPTLARPNQRQGLALVLPRQQIPARNETENRLLDIMKASGIIRINGTDFRTDMKDLLELEELGDGTSGHVVKMQHIPSGAVIAVKQMRRTGNMEENKRIVADIETAMKAKGCPHIVQCLGFIITSADVWICMELMATCFDKLLKRTSRPVPEEILGKVTVAVVKALSFLKDKDTMHRDVKPSNILVDERGIIKLCDFGISGQLNNSKAKTRSAGCVAYLAPERIDPNRSEYDIRADVWSLGITLVELATGKFPYQDCRTDFEVLTCVMQSAPPTLPAEGFSADFQSFVKRCLIHDVNSRPKYKDLLLLPFLMLYESRAVNVAGWLKSTLKLAGLPSHQRDQLSQKEINDVLSYQPIATCSPVNFVTTTQLQQQQQQHSVLAPKLNHFPDRHQFVKPPMTTTTTTTATASPDKQYCKLRIGSLENRPSGSGSIHASHHLHSNYEHHQPIVPEPSKVYRKSPFLPRKECPDNNSTPKKESKLSTLGSSLLKNLTTSPFSQRKQPVPQPQPELPPFLAEKRTVAHFPSRQPETGNNQIPRHVFQNSPLLQRRNPSYVTYAECNASPGKGHSSANTSPIVLQRFFHQQNQLREKTGDNWQTALPTEPNYASADNSNPFLVAGPRLPSRLETKGEFHVSRIQEPKPSNYGFVSDNGNDVGGGEVSYLNHFNEKVAPQATPSYVAQQRKNHEDNVLGPQHQTIRSEGRPLECDDFASPGKLPHDKNLGDVKRRFASYLKVNLSEERRLRAEEFSYQANSQNAPHTAFAPTNPFLDATDCYLVPTDPAIDKLKLDRRHRSPDPPPRYNRQSQSPLLLRKKLEMSNWGGSPLLSRRLISGSPPVQPRRDCESVPGSPQPFRTRIHYTPEPQRRFYRHVD